MATVYSPEYKAGIIERMRPPTNVSMTAPVRETGIPADVQRAVPVTQRQLIEPAIDVLAP